MPVYLFTLLCFPECAQHQACRKGGNTGDKGGEAQDLYGEVCTGNQTLWYDLYLLCLHSCFLKSLLSTYFKSSLENIHGTQTLILSRFFLDLLMF